MAAQLLRQRLQQQVHFFLQHAGHQPLAAVRVNLVQRKQRHRQGHAVARGAGLEVVVQRHRHALPFHLFGKDIGSDAGGFVPHQLVARQHQLGGRGLVQAGHPLFQRGGLRDIGRKLAVVEGEDQLVVHQDVGAARLVFQLFDAGNQLAVVRHERQARVDLARHQRLADEEFARLRRVDAAVMDAPARVDGQPI
ncbi:hypothetical protein D3C72_1653710 [compost metagenome]